MGRLALCGPGVPRAGVVNAGKLSELPEQRACCQGPAHPHSATATADCWGRARGAGRSENLAGWALDEERNTLLVSGGKDGTRLGAAVCGSARSKGCTRATAFTFEHTGVELQGVVLFPY